MKIACLQFAPQVGDTNNNLNRADSVLNRANPEDLQELDLLVLPELSFSGCNFKSLNQISPFLEHSVSGISSLWARTTALKYNTAVVVGYPEKVDISNRWPTSPEYYNSALIVNRDGETVANYRKSFLYATDERWALEGTGGFFRDKPQGLRWMAMGIGMDLNPYRFEAPWDAFEFAYHIVENRVKLVIVTMSWSTREDPCTFSCTPEEPDLDTLTYWTQRLEPVIRKERKDEIIVVFCNRCGKEDKVVYAGTSAVIGIKEGEVNVYGVLGRGVNDLLVVDTDVAPFAKLVSRPEVDLTEDNLAMRHMRTMEWLAQNPSTSRSADKTPAITFRPNQDSLETPIEESPLVETPTAPSPTPLSNRPQVDNTTSNRINHDGNHIDSRGDRNSNLWNLPGSRFHGYQQTLDIDAHEPDSGQILEKYFWIPPQPPLQGPQDASIPILPQASAITTSSLIRVPGNKRNSMKHLPAPELALPPELGGTPYNPSSIPLYEPHQLPYRRGRDVTQTRDERTLERPASPKSRNASRTGRPLDRLSSDTEHPNFSKSMERLESFSRNQISSVNDWSRSERPKTPKSRPSSRMGRPSTTPTKYAVTMNKDSDSGTTLPTDSSIFSNSTRNAPSDTFSTSTGSFERKTREHGTIRPCPRAGAHSRSRNIAGLDSGRPQSRTHSSTRQIDGSVSHVEPDESRTMVWSELSKLVGEVLQRPSTSNASRGRQRGLSDNVYTVPRSSQSEIRATRRASQARHRVMSQDRQTNTGSQIDRSAGSQVPGHEDSYAPGDEIVAEIIFHGQGCPTHSHHHQSTPSRIGTNSQVDSKQRSRTTSMSREPPHHNQDYSPQTKPRQQQTPRTPVGSASAKKHLLVRHRSDQNDLDAVIMSKGSSISRLTSRQTATGSCPPIEGVTNTRTITAKHASPAHTPPRVFEPTTPKAMKLDRVPDDEVQEPAIDIVQSDDFMVPKSYVSDPSSKALKRARSAVW